MQAASETPERERTFDGYQARSYNSKSFSRPIELEWKTPDGMQGEVGYWPMSRVVEVIVPRQRAELNLQFI